MTIPTPGDLPDLDETVQRLKDLSNQAIEASKQNGRVWLETYEKMVNSYLNLQKQAAAGSPVEWVTTLANTNAEIVREMSQVYLNAAREQLK